MYLRSSNRSSIAPPSIFQPIFIAQLCRFHLLQAFVGYGQIACSSELEFRFDLPKTEAVGLDLHRAINRFFRGSEISLHRIIEKHVLQRPAVFRIQGRRLFEIGG